MPQEWDEQGQPIAKQAWDETGKPVSFPAAPMQAPVTGVSYPSQTTMSAAPPMTWTQKAVSALTPPALEEAVQSAAPNVAALLWGPSGVQRSARYSQEHPEAMQGPAGVHATVGPDTTMLHGEEMFTPGTRAYGAVKAVSGLTDVENLKYLALPGGIAGRAAGLGFGAYMTHATGEIATQWRQLKDQRDLIEAAKNPGWQDNIAAIDNQLRELEGGGGASAVMAAVAARHGIKGETTAVPYSPEDFAARAITPGTPLNRIQAGPMKGYYTEEQQAPISTSPQTLPTPRPAGLATGGTIGMDRLDPNDLVAPAAKATTVDRQKMADTRANASVQIDTTSSNPVPERFFELGKQWGEVSQQVPKSLEEARNRTNQLNQIEKEAASIAQAHGLNKVDFRDVLGERAGFLPDRFVDSAIADLPDQPSPISLLPESGYKPSEKAETMSAPSQDLGPDFKINEWKHEIDRNQSVVNNPAATLEERQIASDRLRDAKEGITAVTTPPTPGMVQSLLTGQMEPAMTELRLLRDEVAKREAEESAKPVDLTPKEEPVTAPPSRGSAVDYSLPKPLVDNMETLLDLRKLAAKPDNTPEQTAAINSRISEVSAESRPQLRNHLYSLSDSKLDQLKTEVEGNRDLQTQQSDFIKNRVAENERIKVINQPLKDLQATGGPAKPGVDPETGRQMGVVTPSELELPSRLLIRKIQGKKGFADPSQLIIHPKPEGMSEADYQTYTIGLQAHISDMEHQITDAYETLKSFSGQGGFHSQGFEEVQQSIIAMLHDYDENAGLLGKYPEGLKSESGRKGLGGRAPILPTEAPLKEIGIEESRRLIGKAVNRIPSNEEFLAHADGLAERARVNKMLSDVIGKEKDRRAGKYVPQPKPTPKGPIRPLDDPSQAGYLGAGKYIPESKLFEGYGPPKIKPEPVSYVSDSQVLSAAKERGMDAYKLDTEHPLSGGRGWLSIDGDKWIGIVDSTHEDAKIQLGLDPNRFIRKENDHDYQVTKLTPDAIKTIAEDYKPGRTLTIDYDDYTGKRQSVDVAHWDSLEDLTSQIRRGVANNRRVEVGASGIATVTGMGIGGTIGYAAGHALGVQPELTGSIGMMAGMLAPHVFERLRPELSKIAPLLKNTGISMRDWLRGPDQEPSITPGMDSILDRQRNAPEGMAHKLVSRITQLPPELQKRIFDKFSTINDQAGPWQRLIGQLDPTQRVFNKLKISENDSAYIAARMAEGGSTGRIEIRRAIYKDVINEAQKLGLSNKLNEYLNLTNYRRVYSTLREHADDLATREQNYRTKLQGADLTTNQQVALENDLADVSKARADLQERIKSGQVVPVYNENQVNMALTFFRKNIDPQQFTKINDLATKVWQSNRDILDLAHNGKDHIIPDAEYKTYTDRGIEYTPMKRIMEASVDHPANTGNHNTNISPLYLRHQNIIKALEGSARVNVDPITASANAAFHSIREVRRNQVFNQLIDEAEQDPNGVGNLFKQVPSGYKLGPNESLIGGYRGDGQQVTYAVPRALGETLRIASPAALSTTFAAMSRFAAQQFRKGVTIANVAFAVFSIPRHAMDQLAMSKVGANVFNIPELAGWVRDYAKATGSTIVKGEWYREALKNDALDGTLQRAITPEKDMIPGKGPRRTTIGTIEEFNKRWDSIAKTLTYNRMIEAGHTPVEAAWEARRYGGAPDYSHMGTDMPALNLAFMFLNAKIQYETRLLTAIADKERFSHMAGFVAASTIATLALWEHNHSQRDKDGNLLWNKVPVNDRERYYCILTGTQQSQHTGAITPTYFRVPKSPVSQAFTNPLEDMLFKMSKSDDRSLKQIGLNNFQNWLPGEFDLQEGQIKRSVGYGLLNTMNPIVKVPLGEYANVDPAFGGRPIVPKREEDIETSLQGGAATPDIYKRMGQGGVPGAIAGGTAGATMGAMWGGRTGALIGGAGGAAIGAYGVSPRRLEYGIQGLTGGVGQMTARLADRFTGSQSTFPYRGQEAIKQIPVAGQVAGRFMGSSADQTFLNESRKFYEEYGQQLSTIKNSMNFIKKNQPEQAADYATQHAPEIHLSKLYDASAQKVNKINVKIQMLQSMMEQKQIDEASGFEALQTLFEAKKQIMKAFNGAADSVLKTPPASPSRQEGWSR